MTEKQFNLSSTYGEMLNDASIDRVIAIDTGWMIFAWNRMSEIESGIPKKHALGRRLLEVFPQIQEGDEVAEAFRLAMDGKKCFLPCLPGIFHRDYYENHFIPLQNEEGRIIGVMNIMHNVAHRIKAEEQLHQLNAELQEKYRQLEKANAELATFTSMTGNDLKTPIKKLYTALEFIRIKDGAKLSDSSKAGLRRMQVSLNRIKLLLDDILALSTVSSLSEEYSAVNLVQLARDVQGALHDKITTAKAVVEVQSLPVVTGSKQMLYHLFYNLLHNAIKFQPKDNIPHIHVTASCICSPAGQDRAGKEYVCISFSDNGIGFPSNEAERIFTMFVRLHARADFPGSGIGLTMCRKIAEAHGGYMQAESIPGQGATFRCYLPGS